MVYSQQEYHILMISSSSKIPDVISEILMEMGSMHKVQVSSIAEAQRELVHRFFDFIVINAPLVDRNEASFAIDASKRYGSLVLLLVPLQDYEIITARVMLQGVYTLRKPTNKQALTQASQWLLTSYHKMKKLEKKAVSVEEKMKEIRLVNKAKWLLIEQEKFTENEAHRWIEKQAMDQCVSRSVIAQKVIEKLDKEV